MICKHGYLLCQVCPYCLSAEKSKPRQESLPCPHGRMPIGDSDGWQHCPHCLGVNNIKDNNNF